MIITAHIAAGAAIGSISDINPGIAFAAGVLSHYILDSVPHLEFGVFLPEEERDILKYKIDAKTIIAVGADILIAGILWLYLLFKFKSQNVGIFWGGLGAILPDIIDNSPFWSAYTRKLPILRTFYWIHHTVHAKLESKKWYFGLISYIILAGGLAWYWLKF